MRWLALLGLLAACGRAPDQIRVERWSVPMEQLPAAILVLDRSASMRLPVDPGAPDCPLGCGEAGRADCPAPCPTRWREAVRFTGRYLELVGAVSDVDVVVTPAAPAGCGDPVQVFSSRSQAPITDFDPVLASLRAWSPDGAGPFSEHLQPLVERLAPERPPRANSTHVVLLTDDLDACDSASDGRCRNSEPACRFGELRSVWQPSLLGTISVTAVNVGGLEGLKGEAFSERFRGVAVTVGLPQHESIIVQTQPAYVSEWERQCRLQLAVPPREWSIELRLEGERLERGSDTWTLDQDSVVFTGETCGRIHRTDLAAPLEVETTLRIAPN